MIIFLYGLDTYRSAQKLDEIKNKFKEKSGPSEINIVTFEGGEFDIEKFNNAASQSGFLVSKRLLITKNLLSSKLDKQIAETLKELLDNLKKSENIFVFLEADMPDKRSSLFKKLTKEKKYVQEFKPLEASQLTSWIKKYVAQQKGQIEDSAIYLLVSFVGNNLWQLTNELNKLMAYANYKTVKEKDVEEMVQAKLAENIFGLVDAIATNNKSLAVKLLNEQFKFGLNTIYILSMIVRQFRILVQLKSYTEKKLTAMQISQQANLHPFVVKKLLPLSNKFSLEKLQTIYQNLTDLDQKFKSTSLPSQTLLDLFILQI